MPDLFATMALVRPLDAAATKQAEARQELLTKPSKSLGRLERIANQLAGIYGQARPVIGRKAVFVMAGDHGIVEEGVSAFPPETTFGMVSNFVAGGAGITVLARHVGAEVVVTDVGVRAALTPMEGLQIRKVRPGTANISKGPAMTRDEALAAFQVGIDLVEAEVARGMTLAAVGEMGIANTSPSSAIVAALTGAPVRVVTGRGTGIGDEAFEHKVKVLERALELNAPDPDDALDVMTKVGGLEIAAMSGVILGAAAHRLPVVLDGFISGAAALVAARLCPAAVAYMIPSHLSVEIGHRVVYEELGLTPLFDLEMRLGEGTGAALGITLVEAAAKLLTEMATFEGAGVAPSLDATHA